MSLIKDFKFLIFKFIKFIFNFKLKGIGEMLSLNIDNGNIEFEILLKGEEIPIKVEINSFEIENDYILLKEIKTSKEWLNVVAENFLENRKIKIDKKIAKILKLF